MIILINSTPMKTNIAVYGGSFNPPTLAHYRIVEWVLETWNKVDRIILLPSWKRKDKNFWIDHEKHGVLIREFYKELLELNLPVELDTYFFEGKNETHTSTLQENAYFTECRWIDPEFIYGSDVISTMSWWLGNTQKYIEHVLPKVFVQRPWYDHVDPADYDMKNYRFIEIPDLPDISSTLAKEQVKNAKSVEWILSHNIANIIQSHWLYT